MLTHREGTWQKLLGCFAAYRECTWQKLLGCFAAYRECTWQKLFGCFAAYLLIATVGRNYYTIFVCLFAGERVETIIANLKVVNNDIFLL